MSTLVAFSGKKGDCILVQENMTEADEKLGVGHRTAAGLCQLTQIPMEMQKFDPCPINVNPDRVAYLKGPVGG
jgi:hypothetical protein